MTTLRLEPTVYDNAQLATRLDRRLSFCSHCGRLSCERTSICRRCADDALVSVSLIGEIYSYTVVKQQGEPFVLALVRLSNGSLVTARIVDVDRDLRIGLRVMFAPDVEAARKFPDGLFFTSLGATDIGPRIPR